MVVIIDYGMGNLKSIYNALKYLNLPCTISDDLKEIYKAEKLILPGVGAFKEAMDNLEEASLISVIKEKVSLGTPLLGICLGMQMLFEKGYEGKERNGLGFLKGQVKLMTPKENVKIPHIGWNNIKVNYNNKLLKNLNNDDFVYYVHSYFVDNIEDRDMLAYSTYGGVKIPALVGRGNVFGAQFHPEKSGKIGLEILKNFGEVV